MSPMLDKLLEKTHDHTRRIVILRHGQTALNVEDRIRGWSDVPLDETGEEQAEEMGKKLRHSGIDMLFASDLTRTLQTAMAVSRESGIPIHGTTTALRPWNVGDYTGEPGPEVHKILMRLATNAPTQEIKGGESFYSFKYRVITGMIGILNSHPGKLIGFVCHHRNDRLIRGWYEAGCPDNLDIELDHFNSHGISPGTYDVLDITSDYLE